MTEQEKIALNKFYSGEQPTYSTGVCGSLTCGYGELDFNGYWEYPLDPEYVKAIEEREEMFK